MSILKLEITEKHLKLLKHLRWSINKDNLIISVEDEEFKIPFGENNLYDAIDLILNGKPKDFDPLNTSEIKNYSPEQKAEWDKLYAELPMCLSIILQKQSFETGIYKTKFHDVNWVKID